MVTSQVSVLIGTVPLFAVTQISLNEQYGLPPVGDKGNSQSTSKITRTVQIQAALLGVDGPITRLGLEMMADLSKTLPLASSLISGIPLVAGLTTLMDMQIDSLNFIQTAEEKGVYTVSISLKHCPRPGLMALLSNVTNAASAIVGAATLASSSPRKV
jgi:ABC-type dipeptide/oligopeptide/nickel transport system permease component